MTSAGRTSQSLRITIFPDRAICSGVEECISPALKASTFTHELAQLRRPCPDAEGAAVDKMLRGFGLELYRRAFGKRIRKLIDASAPAPLALDVRGGGLASVPWEFLHNGESWLALSRGVIRTFRSERPLAHTEFTSNRLVVSALLCDPLVEQGSAEAPTPVLGPGLWAATAPLRRLNGAPVPAKVSVHCHATWDDLARELGHRPQVLYFHGCGGRGWIGLEDRHGALDLVRSATLEQHLGAAVRAGLGLAVLEVPGDYLGGTARALVRASEGDAVHESRSTLRVRSAALARTLLAAGLPACLVIQSALPASTKAAMLEALLASLAGGKDIVGVLRSARESLTGREPAGTAWAAVAAFVQPELLDTGAPLARVHGGPDKEKQRLDVTGMARELPAPLCRDEPVIGRYAELVRLTELLDSPEPVVWLTGPDGIGKTALAALAAQRVSRWFDETVYLPLGDADTDAGGCEELIGDADLMILAVAARSLGLVTRAGEEYDLMLERLRGHLATGRRRFVIFDDPPPKLRKVVQDLLDCLPACCKAIVTGRERLCATGAEVALGPMPEEDVAALFAERGVASPGRLSAAAGGHPCAARLLAGLIHTQGEGLGDMSEALALPHLVNGAIEAAPPEAVELWQAASMFAPGVHRSVLQQFFDDEVSFSRSLDGAVRNGLVTACAGGGFLFVHHLLRRMGRRLFEERANRQEGTVKAARHLLSLCAAAGSLSAASGRQGVAASVRGDLARLEQRLLEMEHCNVMQALRWLEEASQWRDVERFSSRMYEMFRRHGHWPAAIACGRIALQAARRHGDRSVHARAAVRHASALASIGLLDQARELAEEGLVALRELGENKTAQLEALRRLARIARRQGRRMDAVAYYQQALVLSHEIVDGSAEAEISLELATVAQQQDDLAKAERLCSRRLDIQLANGDLAAAVKTLHALAAISHQRKDLDSAWTWCEKRVELCERIGDEAGRRDARMSLGALAQLRGDDDLAQEILADLPAGAAGGAMRRAISEAAGDELGRLGDDEALAGAAEVTVLANMLTAEGRLAEAARLCEHGATIYDQIGEGAAAAAALRAQAGVVFRLGRSEEALALLDRSARISHDCGDSHGEAEAHCRAAELSFWMDRHALGGEYLGKALHGGLLADEMLLRKALGTMVNVARDAARRSACDRLGDVFPKLEQMIDQVPEGGVNRRAVEACRAVFEGLRAAMGEGEQNDPRRLRDLQRGVVAAEQRLGELGLSSWLSRATGAGG